jgi:hypothetical protein
VRSTAESLAQGRGAAAGAVVAGEASGVPDHGVGLLRGSGGVPVTCNRLTVSGGITTEVSAILLRRDRAWRSPEEPIDGVMSRLADLAPGQSTAGCSRAGSQHGGSPARTRQQRGARSEGKTVVGHEPKPRHPGGV